MRDKEKEVFLYMLEGFLVGLVMGLILFLPL
jgi:hypothetical protein